jgi:glycolate dehydrogenase FAD-linked subunit
MPDLAPLIEALPSGSVITDPDGMSGYRWDRALDNNAGTPLAVIRPESTEEVQRAVAFAAEHGLAIVPRGEGSGLSGGASAVDGCLVISLERMRAISIDPVTKTAHAQAGALNSDIKKAAAEHGLWYPPDPSSFDISSIGGNVATNAGGLCCVKYGVTSDYVLGMRVVLADGSAVTLGGPRLKDVAGLSLTKLFVGSEGTLGIITEATLKLLPSQRPAATLVATFPSLADASQTVIDITSVLRPSMLEFMDSICINAVEDLTKMGLDRTAAAMLIIQSDEPGDSAGAEIARIEEFCTVNNATEVYSTDDPEEAAAFVVARRMVFPAIEKLGAFLLEDVGVPLSRFVDLMLGIQEIARANEIMISVVAHAGDGNTHPHITFDPSDPRQRERATAAFDDIMALAISLGGTITGEHGVGRLKRDWLPNYLGDDAMALNQRIKSALDPNNILNPGAVFPQ